MINDESSLDDYMCYVYTMTGRNQMDIEISGQTSDDAIDRTDSTIIAGSCTDSSRSDEF